MEVDPLRDVAEMLTPLLSAEESIAAAGRTTP
jgi:hypothetical protein